MGVPHPHPTVSQGGVSWWLSSPRASTVTGTGDCSGRGAFICSWSRNPVCPSLEVGIPQGHCGLNGQHGQWSLQAGLWPRLSPQLPVRDDTDPMCSAPILPRECGIEQLVKNTMRSKERDLGRKETVLYLSTLNSIFFSTYKQRALNFHSTLGSGNYLVNPAK